MTTNVTFLLFFFFLLSSFVCLSVLHANQTTSDGSAAGSAIRTSVHHQTRPKTNTREIEVDDGKRNGTKRNRIGKKMEEASDEISRQVSWDLHDLDGTTRYTVVECQSQHIWDRDNRFRVSSVFRDFATTSEDSREPLMCRRDVIYFTGKLIYLALLSPHCIQYLKTNRLLFPIHFPSLRSSYCHQMLTFIRSVIIVSFYLENK